jgi:hypothetical protein
LNFIRRMKDGSYTPCPGNPKPIHIAGAEWGEFYASRFDAPDGESEAKEQKYWFVYHKPSGLCIAGGETFAKAGCAARDILAWTPGIKERLESLPKAKVEGVLF